VPGPEHRFGGNRCYDGPGARDAIGCCEQELNDKRSGRLSAHRLAVHPRDGED
jgi:hypothetical protein